MLQSVDTYIPEVRSSNRRLFVFVLPVAFRFTNSFQVGVTYYKRLFHLSTWETLSRNLNLSSTFPISLEIIPFVVCVCVSLVCFYTLVMYLSSANHFG